MTPPEDDETLWRNRFIAVNMMRIGSTMIVLLGLVIWQTDMIVEPNPWLGIPITFIALIASFWGPIYMQRRWKGPRRR
jgi:F0F1-type ATP synthase assembly protein I